MAESKEKKSFAQRFLDAVEKLGNKLPDPIVLFMIIAGLILLASWIAGMFGLSAKIQLMEKQLKQLTCFQVTNCQ